MSQKSQSQRSYITVEEYGDSIIEKLNFVFRETINKVTEIILNKLLTKFNNV